MANEWIEKSFSELMSLKGFDTSLKEGKKVEKLGLYEDASYYKQSEEGLLRVISLFENIDYSLLNEEEQILYHYFLSNAWDDKRKLQRIGNKLDWDLNQEEHSNSIINLRKAINHNNFQNIDKFRQSQIYTNLASTLDNIGRYSEALYLYDKALIVNPALSNAIISKGICLLTYSRFIEHTIDKSIFLNHSYKYLRRVPEFKNEIDFISYPYLNSYKEEIEKRCRPDFLEMQIPLTEDKITSKDELNYQIWCRNNGLYLSYINSITSENTSAYDNINLPSLLLHIEDKPYYHDFYNEIKQLYVSARYMLYSYEISNEIHYSDNNVFIADTLQNSLFGYKIELLKSAFKNAYSVFDKIAYFLNLYYKLGVKLNQVSINKIWYEKKILRNEFQNRQNLSLRGLFWLSKDLFSDDNIYKEALNPTSKDIATLRNFLEHKSVIIYNGELIAKYDEILYISKTDFYSKTLELLKLSRHAIIYLIGAVHVEELLKKRDNIEPQGTTEYGKYKR